jgi:phthalate 4,5-dioxygenase oxygenase subunit
MLTREENDRLCRIGPGTPMGTMFRRFWLPICTADRLPHPGCAPLAERLLGEDFVVFRNGNGQVGVLDELCMHRGASLALGRVEDCGIRCIYHGWKFGNDGEVLEIMNNRADKPPANFKAPAYPAVDAGGMVWVYLGPPEKQPPFPRFAYMELPDNHRVLMRVNGNFNWVQATESGLDSSHVGILHSNVARPGWNGQTDETIGAMEDTAPALEIEDTEFGYHYAAFRKDPVGGLDNVRVVPFIMPSGRIIPGGQLQGQNNHTLVLEIPIDDENTATYSVRYGSAPIPRDVRLRETGFDDPDMYSEASQQFLWTRSDLHRQRRDMMDRNWSGFRGIAAEDAVIATSMRPIQDRTKEHLIASDLGVVRFRRRLLESVAQMERGADPIGVAADVGAISSIDAPVPARGHWRTLLPRHLVVQEGGRA